MINLTDEYEIKCVSYNMFLKTVERGKIMLQTIFWNIPLQYVYCVSARVRDFKTNLRFETYDFDIS